MDVLKNGRKKAVSWYKCSDVATETKSDGEESEVVIRQKSGRHPNKCRSLENKHLKTMSSIKRVEQPNLKYLEPSGLISSTDYLQIIGSSIPSQGSLSTQRMQRQRQYHVGKLNTRLLEAVENGDTEEIDKLLKQDANPNATCRLNHVSACHMAALNNNDALALLLQAGAEGFRTDKLGRTPLHLASWEGHPQQIAVLLDFPESLKIKLVLEMSPETEQAVRTFSSGRQHRINAPCNIGRLPALPHSWSDSMEHNCRRIKVNLPLFQPGWTALHAASARAQVKCVQLLLAAGAEPSPRDVIGRTPLDVVGDAHYSGHKIDIHDFRKTIKVLVSGGGTFYSTQVTCLNKVNSPLHTAVQLDSVEAIEELLRTGARATCLDAAGRTPMHVCVDKRHKEHLQILVNYNYDEQETVDAKDLEGLTVLHAAVRAKWTDGVCIALGAGASVFMKANDGESPVHSAAATGHTHIFRKILTVAKYDIDFQNQKGQTALFVAIINNHIEIVEILIANGACLRVTLPDQQNILHVASRCGHVELLAYLLNSGGRIIASLVNDLSQTAYSPIMYAVVNNHPECVRLLLKKGATLSWPLPYKFDDCEEMALLSKWHFTSVLHVAATNNFFGVVKIIVDFDRETINAVNGAGLFPLHVACLYGNRDIITFLIHKGDDLSRQAVACKKKLTPIEILMNHLSKPTAYMQDIFDRYITSKGMSLQDRECKVTVTYDILMPEGCDGKQMKVIKALVDTGNRHEQRQLLQHPFIESFLCLKWQALIPYFYVIVALYACFVLSLNVYVVSVFYYQDKNNRNDTNITSTRSPRYIHKPVPDYLYSNVWKYLVYVTAILIMLQQIMFIKMKNKRYFLLLETWVRFGALSLAIILPSFVSWRDESIAYTTETTTVYVRTQSPEWARLIATIALLLSWLEMMFLLSRFPNWGFYVLMFGKVATKVVKILLTFMFLIFGFSLCFMIQFRAKQPFEGPWAAVTKTLVMMTSEYDYSNMINKKSAENLAASILILRLIFITFVVLTSIVLMNLMVGVAVNDVNNLEVLGNQQRLERQVDFLATVEDIACNNVIRKILPSRITARWYKTMTVNNVIELRPREATCTYSKILPSYLREAIFEKAQIRKKKNDDVLDMLVFQSKLDEIHNMIVREEKQPPDKDDQLRDSVEKLRTDMEEMRRDLSMIREMMFMKNRSMSIY
ncbi:transient receptor potential cation channel subfamily A member 1-like [Anticarsia gemmatalis]|uniref:transient receptor potential cation channel subfamily A member 1-like n=1 Tax=Anticarsia gemmatalis TaxID=129554 RepID=UPI003F775382